MTTLHRVVVWVAWSQNAQRLLMERALRRGQNGIDETLGRAVPMPSDVVIDEGGRRICIGGATDNNDATAEICVTTIQGGCDTETWCQYAETEQAGVASTVPYLRLGAEFKELAAELGRRSPDGTVPKG
jgi:hypothetical protein